MICFLKYTICRRNYSNKSPESCEEIYLFFIRRIFKYVADKCDKGAWRVNWADYSEWTQLNLNVTCPPSTLSHVIVLTLISVDVKLTAMFP